VNGKKRKDALLLSLIWLCAFITVLILLGIIGYILYKGLPNLSLRFLTTEYSASKNGSQGILPMIINTVYVVVLTLLLAVPICIGGAIYMTQYARQGRVIRVIRFATEVLSGIPSVIFGLFGYAIFVVLFQLKLSILSGSFFRSSSGRPRNRFSPYRMLTARGDWHSEPVNYASRSESYYLARFRGFEPASSSRSEGSSGRLPHCFLRSAFPDTTCRKGITFSPRYSDIFLIREIRWLFTFIIRR